MQTTKQCQTVPNSAKYGCVPVPLGSPTVSLKRLFLVTRPYFAWPALGVGCGPGGYQGGVYRVLPGGLYRVPTHRTPALLGEQTLPAKRAPEGLQGLEWVGRVQRANGRRGRVLYHPSGPVGATRGPPCTGPLECRPGPIEARIDLILWKLSQNAEVSPKYVEKACLSPCSQNEAQKSPLDFLGFPVSTAFSHKELMGRSDPHGDIYCQNDEVSPVVHT